MYATIFHMEIIIHINLRKLDTDYKKAVEEYVKRTSPFCKIKLVFYKNINSLKTSDSSFVYFVVPGTETLSSEGLAEEITKRNLEGYSRLEFVVAGENFESVKKSLTESSKEKAKDFSCFSFALSCDLTTCVLTEQLYRAYTILNNITYHK